MYNWMANRMDDVGNFHVEIDNLNDLLVGLCFIRDIDGAGKWGLGFCYVL
jgi:hypothetical protein